jgi:hypothetical protein
MRRLLTVVATIAMTTWASARLDAAPFAPPGMVRADRPSLLEKTQLFHLGRPYCWYPYGWAGPGWYWCGFGTHAGIGWGGAYGWNRWAVPRNYRAVRSAPAHRFRRYR